jgi:hypothetical protein
MTIKTIPIKPGQTRIDYLRAAMRYCRKEYNKLRAEPYLPHCSHDASKAMEATERKYIDLGTFGVEGFTFTDSYTAGLQYLNTGETYEQTITFRSDTEQFRITSYGDFIENNPKLCRE